jgi:hypothetical protein
MRSLPLAGELSAKLTERAFRRGAGFSSQFKAQWRLNALSTASRSPSPASGGGRASA